MDEVKGSYWKYRRHNNYYKISTTLGEFVSSGLCDEQVERIVELHNQTIDKVKNEVSN